MVFPVVMYGCESWTIKKVKETESEVAQSCLTLCDPMDCSPQVPRSMGFSRHEYWSGLLFPSPGESPRPRDRTQVVCNVGRHFTVWATREAHKESWGPKIWCFWTVVLEKTLESPLDCREIHQSILKEISPEYSLEGLMLKLKLQSFGCKEQTHLKRPWCWERLKAGEGNRGWDDWMASFTHWTWIWTNSGRQWRTGKPGVLQSMGSQKVRHNWTTTIPISVLQTQLFSHNQCYQLFMYLSRNVYVLANSLYCFSQIFPTLFCTLLSFFPHPVYLEDHFILVHKWASFCRYSMV